MSQFKADIIIPHHNRSDLLKVCLDSIPINDYNVIIVRGGSYAENCNTGFASCRTNDIIFANDDVIFNAKSLNELSLSTEDIKIARQEGPSGDIYIGFYYNGVNFTPVWEERLVKCPNSAVFKIKRYVLNEIGLFDENFINGGEDQDLFFRAILYGYKFSFTQSKIYHALSQSEGRFLYTRENHSRLVDKHLNNLKLFSLSHDEQS